MEIRRIHERMGPKVADISVCGLIALCLCFPAQSQIIKVPFLGLACLLGLIRLWQSKGRAVSKHSWIWFGAYLIYNVIWSVLGFANGNQGAKDYFRLGVIWPVAFFFLMACIRKDSLKWISRVIMACVVVQVVSIFILIGHAFQLWPNILSPVFQDWAVGIHPGYIHVVSHFVGGLAFSGPFLYAYMVLNHKIKPLWQGLFIPAWFLVVLALVATSRRVLLVVLLVCAAAVLVIPFLRRENRTRLFIRAVSGLVLTGVFIVAATSMVVTVSTQFLSNNYDAVLKVIQNRPEEQDALRYTDSLVFDLTGILPPDYEEPTEPGSSDATDPDDTDPSGQTTKPTKPNNSQVGNEGIKDRYDSLLGEMGEGAVRGRILGSVLNNWTKSPLFGVGFGAQLPGYPGRPDGIYEMEYVVRLYTTGLVGVAILLLLMLYVGFAPLRHICKKGTQVCHIAPCTVAYLGAVVATLSNPYIFSGFDYLFMLFLPVAFLNSVNTEKETSEGKEC